jgi:hypothetical protein
MFRKKKSPPTPTPLPQFGSALRATQTFTYDGLRFEKGALVSGSDELVRRIIYERPDLFA